MRIPNKTRLSFHVPEERLGHETPRFARSSFSTPILVSASQAVGLLLTGTVN